MSTWKNRPSIVIIGIACHRDEDLVNYTTDEGRDLGSDLCHEPYQAGVTDWSDIVLHVQSSGHESRDDTFASGYDREEKRKIVRAEIARPDGHRVGFSSAGVSELAEFFAKEINEGNPCKI